MSFSVIAAIDANRCIGVNNELPWPRIKADFQHFLSITRGDLSEDRWNAVIMGRKTWESLPEKSRPLANRINVVLTSNQHFGNPEQQVFRAGSLDEAVQLLHSEILSQKLPFPLRDIFVIGGSSVFGEAVGSPECDRIYLTEIHYTAEHCDTFFPTLPTAFEEIRREPQQEGDMTFDFVEYARKK